MITDLGHDVGMNNGDDTAHDLQRGYRVVAVWHDVHARLGSDAPGVQS